MSSKDKLIQDIVNDKTNGNFKSWVYSASLTERVMFDGKVEMSYFVINEHGFQFKKDKKDPVATL